MCFFNTEGPVEAKDHYCIPPLERIDLDEILRLIAWKRYFVLRALAERLNADGEYRCLYINVE